MSKEIIEADDLAIKRFKELCLTPELWKFVSSYNDGECPYDRYECGLFTIVDKNNFFGYQLKLNDLILLEEIHPNHPVYEYFYKVIYFKQNQDVLNYVSKLASALEKSDKMITRKLWWKNLFKGKQNGNV